MSMPTRLSSGCCATCSVCPAPNSAAALHFAAPAPCMSTEYRRVPASPPSGESVTRPSLQSRRSAARRRVRRCRKPGSTSRWCNAAIANPARSCRPRRCSPVRRSRAMPTSTPRCPAMSADAAPISASVPRSIAPPAEKESTMLDHSMIPRIDRRGAVTLVMPMVEMGQGIYTAMAMLLAEELEVGLDQVRLEHAPPNDALYANSILHIQTTGLSASIRAFWTPLRQAGAVGRVLLIEAAAKQWGVDPSTCRAQHGAVLHSASSRRLGYGELADAAATLPVPARDSVPLKQLKDFTLIGTPAKRLDTPDKVDGRAEVGIDTRLEGMTIAAIAISPVLGGKPKSVNEAAALSVKGVRQVVRIDEAVAVVADNMWAAKKGLKATATQWDDGANATVDSASLIRQLEEASKQPGVVARNEGDAEAALAGAAQRIEAIYQLPFLAHAAMEPMNCTVHLRKDGCDIWVGTQAPTLTQAMVAELTGLPKDAVKIHNHLLGGGFGRRLDADGTMLAVKIAQQVNGPVKVVWSREEDIQHDMYRPYYYDRLSGGLDANGKPVAIGPIHNVLD